MMIEPITLTGNLVRLVPLTLDHVPDLTAAAQDDSIWRYMPYGTVRTPEQMTKWVRDCLDRQQRRTDLPFAVTLRETGQAIGATRYLQIEPAHRRLEIGGTWYTPTYQRTGVNTECKYLLLSHAFEALNALRVQFKTDLRNERSQKAIERIGAVREGVLRQHTLMPDGYRRSTIVSSIIDSEWPTVKARLDAMMHTVR